MRRQGPVYAFGDFRLDAARRSLSPRVGGGAAIALPDPAFDILAYLVEHAGEMVERAALLQAAWPLVTVVENSVSQAVSALRRALGDDPAAPRYVSTVSGRGYRFVAEVTTESAGDLDPRAQQLYAAGWSALSRPGAETLTRALDCLQQALELEPDFALAEVCLAECYIMLGSHGIRPGAEVIPLALAAAQRAVAADPNLGDAQASLANLRLITHSLTVRDGLAILQRLAEQNPGSFWVQRYLGLGLMQSGDQEAAIRVLRQAQVIEPLAVHNNGNIGMALYFAGRYREAVAQLEMTLTMDPDFGVARTFLGRAWLQLGEIERAIAEFKQSRHEVIGLAADIPVALALSGRTEAARAALAGLLSRPREVMAIDLASIYAALGETDAALTWLEHAVEAGPFGFFAVDPVFKGLRGQPRFEALVDRIGLRPTRP
jgi:DNA-binding winged helix-turn-helix (wHTH) protein/thioredoxin-like negative regulator of GroEL